MFAPTVRIIVFIRIATRFKETSLATKEIYQLFLFKQKKSKFSKSNLVSERQFN
jgi:hypothetical protein